MIHISLSFACSLFSFMRPARPFSNTDNTYLWVLSPRVWVGLSGVGVGFKRVYSGKVTDW